MITKRQYFTILIVFLTIFLLFQGLQVGKSYFAETDVNKFFSPVTLDGGSARTLSDAALSDREYGADAADRILFVGDKDGEYAATAIEWAYYTGRTVYLCDKLEKPADDRLPGLILLEPDLISGNEDLIDEYLEKGADFIFLALPDVKDVQYNYQLRSILGIYKIRNTGIQMHGIRLFVNFLLGGERIFEVTSGDPDEERMQDLKLDLPWYSVRNGTKTFVQGILGQEDLKQAISDGLKNEDMPAVVWRNHRLNGEVYAVNSDYMLNRKIGMGMLEAMYFHRNEYDIYPVVNAQVFSLADFPMLTDENNDEVERIYGQSITRSESDIMLPMLISLSSKYGVKPNCYMSVKIDANDPQEPGKGRLGYFLDIFSEMDAELCLSTKGRGVSPEEKLVSDFGFYSEEGIGYPVASAFALSGDADAVAGAINSSGWKDVRTIAVFGDDGKSPLIGYADEKITLQRVTSDLDFHSFTDELELLGVQTLLAYSHSYYDIENTFRPESKRSEWQHASQRVFSNLTTYNAPFSAMDKLTLTESDARIRSFLSLEYSAERTGDKVTLRANGFDKQAFFILRTHNEEVQSVSGGSFKRIEKDAYLITAESEKVEIELSSSLEKIVDMKEVDGQ
ncbi:MAG: DUF2194 domain-containing protein [Clostridia bacterium]|nr:DUF2194 domain-containing protein [Clostridia bacterium]